MCLILRSIIGLVIVMNTLSSCTPKAPHEARSPCVSVQDESPYLRNPCIRRPLNQNGWDIV